MQFTAPMAMINLDGNLDDWQCAPIKAQTPFYPFNKEGGIGPAGATFAEGTHCCGDELTMFDDRDGLTWNALDQSSAISFAWDAGNFYIGVKVVDDSHENAAGSGWNGDSVQIAFTDSSKQRITHLYNYAWAASGEIVTHHEQGHPEAAPNTEAAIVRQDTVTIYEIKIPAYALQTVTGTPTLAANTRFGVGIAVNDGDVGVNGEDIGEGGQQGWSGWGPYTVVYGKTPSQAGLVTLSQSPPDACPQAFECMSNGQQPIAFKQCPATPSCAGDSSYHWSKGQAICPTACGTDETVIERPATCQLVRQKARPCMKPLIVVSRS